ncbi:MAG TPA: branched-chain amino acid ABC transporter substrate-binding protein [Candidatus Elarobacter sp.]|jgi:branched-chain amino acid transport system substrate-binding protein|nr:branched-chain amino acid ABC transporter substrate-binding protein [Candidatus Elarobacter sp.]
MKNAFVLAVAGLMLLGGMVPPPAMAEDTIKIGYIDPLSGSGASTGQIGLDQLNYIAEQINAKGGLLGAKVQIVPYDNKVNPQETLVQVQKAIDDGVRIITQGNGSSVAIALENFVAKYNERNPGKEVVYLNYAAIDPVLTNEDCSYWHFSFDANVDIKMTALTNFMKKKPAIKKIYLINQDYSFGHSVADAATSMLKTKRPDIQIVGSEFVPLLKVTDFSPYIAKIKASGADSVITGNWGQDFALLLKAAADAGLKVDWYTYYASIAGGPTAIKEANLPNRVYQITEGVSDASDASARRVIAAYLGTHKNPFYYPRIFNETGMLFEAIREAKSADPAKFAPKLEGMKYATFSSGAQGFMRNTDHQFFQPLFISSLGPVANAQFTEENTGWSWNAVGSVPTEDTLLPTTCKMKRP